LKKIKLTFQWKIFLSYSLFFSLLVSGLFISFYLYVSSTLENSAFSQMKQSVKSVSSQLDSIVDKMDTISNIVALNKNIQYALIDAESFNQGDTNFFDTNTGEETTVYQTLFSIIGLQNTPSMLCIFNGKQNYVFFSLQPYSRLNIATDLSKLSWVNELNKQGYGSIIICPDTGLWVSSDTNLPIKVISFTKKIVNTWGPVSTIGYLEIQQPYSLLDSICKSSVSNNTKIIVMNENGKQIYPSSINPSADYYYKNTQNSNNKDTFILKNPKDGKNVLVCRYFSQETQWTIMQVTPQKDVMNPVYFIQALMISGAILLLIMTTFIVYFITKSLTTPIKKLRKSLLEVSIDTPTLDLNFQGNNNEIVMLNMAFNKTIQRLHESMQIAIDAYSKEVEAHYLALQSQMNPHFLYNSLMAISAVAQECNDQTTVNMCTMLSQMLRYTASYNKATVSLSEEIKNAENYLMMLKYRHENNLHYKFNHDEGFENIQVPKLILQPLIENCFSHGFSNIKPPYDIIVTVSIQNNLWKVSICDNGAGFSEESITNIFSQIDKYNESIMNHSYKDKLDFGGLAILNIYVRLKIFYKEDTFFNIANLSDGAVITIGGKIASII
jgi:two-component system sensor histidine kinase YesM